MRNDSIDTVKQINDDNIHTHTFRMREKERYIEKKKQPTK